MRVGPGNGWPLPKEVPFSLLGLCAWRSVSLESFVEILVRSHMTVKTFCLSLSWVSVSFNNSLIRAS